MKFPWVSRKTHNEVVKVVQKQAKTIIDLRTKGAILAKQFLKMLPQMPEDAPPWSQANVLALKAFFATPTGATLLKRARAMEYNRSVNACSDVFHTQHSAGVAKGITDTLNWIESLASPDMLERLSRPSGDQEGKPDTSDSDHEDAALLERLSP